MVKFLCWLVQDVVVLNPYRPSFVSRSCTVTYCTNSAQKLIADSRLYRSSVARIDSGWISCAWESCYDVLKYVCLANCRCLFVTLVRILQVSIFESIFAADDEVTHTHTFTYNACNAYAKPSWNPFAFGNCIQHWTNTHAYPAFIFNKRLLIHGEFDKKKNVNDDTHTEKSRERESFAQMRRQSAALGRCKLQMQIQIPTEKLIFQLEMQHTDKHFRAENGEKANTRIVAISSKKIVQRRSVCGLGWAKSHVSPSLYRTI